jgi:hypothetical protein
VGLSIDWFLSLWFSLTILLLSSIFFEVDLIFYELDDDEDGEYEAHQEPHEDVTSLDVLIF